MLKYSVHRDKKEFSFHGSQFRNLKQYNLNLNDNPELETFMDFPMFLKFYNADPENWAFGKTYYDSEKCYHPVYIDQDREAHVIKFSSRFSYRRFIRWRIKELKKHNDYENLQEQIQLSEMIRKRAMIKAKMASERVLQAQQACHKYMLSPEERESLPTWVQAVQETQHHLDNQITEKGQRKRK